MSNVGSASDLGQRVTCWHARLLIVAAASLMACATTRQHVTAEEACQKGSADACDAWASELLVRGDPKAAADAYGKACAGGLLTSCLSQGKLLLDQGNPAAAEPPLRKAYEAEMPEGAAALAELYQARGAEGDAARAARLRFEAPAMDKPNSEWMFGLRSTTEGMGFATTLTLQPMAFAARRISFGAQAAFSPRALELNGVVGWRHYFTPHLIGTADAMLGTRPRTTHQNRINVGGELGLRVAWSNVGHVYFAAGQTRGSGFYGSVGFGVNSLYMLLMFLTRAH